MVMEGWYLILQIGRSGAKCRRLPVDQLDSAYVVICFVVFSFALLTLHMTPGLVFIGLDIESRRMSGLHVALMFSRGKIFCLLMRWYQLVQ